MLRDTDWVVGAAVYTGHDTKIMKNSSKAVVKRSKNSKALNYYILICMAVQLVCSVVGAMISLIQAQHSLGKSWYLFDENGNRDDNS